MTNLSKGRRALAISDRSGMQFPYREMVKEWNGAFVHISEYEPKQPQLDPINTPGDPQGLQNARPDRTEPPTFDILPDNPFSSTALSAIINVWAPNINYTNGDYVRFSDIKSSVSDVPVSAIQLASTLNGAINATQNTIAVTNLSYFPTTGYVMIEKINPTTRLFQNETIFYNGIIGGVLQNCVRGTAAPFRGVTPSNTTASTHENGANIYGSFSITLVPTVVPNPGVPSTKTVYNSFTFTSAGVVAATATGGGFQCSAGPIVLKP